MTKRERYLKALRNEPVDELVWAPNFDYWLGVNRAEGTLPEKYEGMSRNDIVRSLDAYIWNRAAGLKTCYDESVKRRSWQEDGSYINEFSTPVGTVRQAHINSEGEHRTKFLAEHFVKSLDDLDVVTYIVEAMYFEPDFESTERALQETGDDGVVLNNYFCVPFIQFAKTDVGYQNAFYMWMDHKEKVDTLLNAYQKKYLEGYSLLAKGPADVICSNDNMDGSMVSPDIFKEYAVPFYAAAREIVSAGGKLFEGHWCGRTQTLLDLVPGSGLDIVEAIVTKPMADVELCEAIDKLKGEVVLQGGIPSVIVCEEGGTMEDFKRYIEDVILPLKGRKGFILGMSDNVPPNADFTRVEMISELIKN